MRHGDPAPETPLDVFLSDDPDLAMVNADMDAYLDAHPCDCEALCVCDEEQSKPRQHRPESSSIYCRYCGAHPMYWSHPCGQERS